MFYLDEKIDPQTIDVKFGEYNNFDKDSCLTNIGIFQSDKVEISTLTYLKLQEALA